MKKFKAKFTEKLSRTVYDIEAESKDDAYTIAHNMYENKEIVLDRKDLKFVEITVEEYGKDQS